MPGYLITVIFVDNEPIIAQLDAAMAYYRTQTFAQSTNRTYSTHMKTYVSFCNIVGIQLMPISQMNLARYIVFLASKLSYASMKQYLNIVRIIHLEGGLPNPLDGSWYLQSLLKGCKRALGVNHKPKLPMTIELLGRIFKCINLSKSSDLVFWAACLLGFYSFLRKSNFLVQAGQVPDSCIRRKDITFLTGGATLRISHSKTIQCAEREAVIPVPHIPGSPFCPCTALLLVYKLVTASDEAPLLCYPSPSGPRPLSYQMFISRLKAILIGLGVDHTKYAGHSFRRGGASLALACNLPTELIKLQGDWRSDCYQRYLDPDLDTKFTVADAMAKKVGLLTKS